MYDYRQMTSDERAKVLAMRKAQGRPWHAPPHFGQTRGVYMVSAACYEHLPIMTGDLRRAEWERALMDTLGLISPGELDIRAWVVLPNHYHLLVEGDLRVFARRIARLHNGKATQWNGEDQTKGRRVWHRFSDRLIRSERHYYASLNYIHANPVKHGYAASPADWAWSSFSLYLEARGENASLSGGGNVRSGSTARAGTSRRGPARSVPVRAFPKKRL
jgi:putative transposase